MKAKPYPQLPKLSQSLQSHSHGQLLPPMHHSSGRQNQRAGSLSAECATKHHHDVLDFINAKNLCQYFLLLLPQSNGSLQVSAIVDMFKKPRVLKHKDEEAEQWHLYHYFMKLIKRAGLTPSTWFHHVSMHTPVIHLSEFTMNILSMTIQFHSKLLTDSEYSQLFRFIVDNSEDGCEFQLHHLLRIIDRSHITPDQFIKLNDVAKSLGELQAMMEVYFTSFDDFRKRAMTQSSSHGPTIGITDLEHAIALMLLFQRQEHFRSEDHRQVLVIESSPLAPSIMSYYDSDEVPAPSNKAFPLIENIQYPHGQPPSTLIFNDSEDADDVQKVSVEEMNYRKLENQFSRIDYVKCLDNEERVLFRDLVQHLHEGEKVVINNIGIEHLPPVIENSRQQSKANSSIPSRANSRNNSRSNSRASSPSRATDISTLPLIAGNSPAITKNKELLPPFGKVKTAASSAAVVVSAAEQEKPTDLRAEYFRMQMDQHHQHKHHHHHDKA